MEVTTRKSLFLRGLQAAYTHVLEVYEDACHVAVYRYLSDLKKWEKMDIEGSAYLTRNSCAPFYSLIVLNKKGKGFQHLICLIKLIFTDGIIVVEHR